MKFVLSLAFFIFSLSGCQKTGNEPELSALAKRGKFVYFSNCIVCHNQNPKLAGSVGPDLYGSSLELITSRVMLVQYPPHYTPKRQSHLMIALPQLEKDIPALHAFLNGPMK